MELHGVRRGTAAAREFTGDPVPDNLYRVLDAVRIERPSPPAPCAGAQVSAERNAWPKLVRRPSSCGT
jgi:hypothetical protein